MTSITSMPPITPLFGKFGLDDSTKLQLQLHMLNTYHLAKNATFKPNPLELGTIEQLCGATKVSIFSVLTPQASIVRWFDQNTKSFNSPLLKNYAVVACIGQGKTAKVTAIYSLYQMHMIEVSQRDASKLSELKWFVLKIPGSVRAYLLETMNLEAGLILTTLRAVSKDDWHVMPAVSRL